MHFMRGLNATEKESGQIVVWFAFLLPFLLLVMGLAIDAGLGYLTKAQLARAADATALTAMRTLGQGQGTATSLAQSVFASNPFLGSGLYTSAPSATITYTTDSYGDPIVNVAASATIRTFFMRLGGINTLTVSDASQATRPPVILSMALDRSGSMGPGPNGDGGGAALPPAVQEFLYYFIEGTDQLGEVSFANTNTIDVPITKTFQTPINNSLNSMRFTGFTYALGGLEDAQTQVQSVVPPPNAVKVVVYFTDGWANTYQGNLNCPTSKLVNFGGEDTGSGYTVWLSTDTTSKDISSSCSPKTFPTTDPELPNPAPLSGTNITAQTEYSARALANQMRAQGTTVYSIGLGSDIDYTYLLEIANAQSYTDSLGNTYTNPYYDASNNPGMAEFAPQASDLKPAFQDIASKILLRLTH